MEEVFDDNSQYAAAKPNRLGPVNENKQDWQSACEKYNQYCKFSGSPARLSVSKPTELLQLALRSNYDFSKIRHQKDARGRSIIHFLALVGGICAVMKVAQGHQKNVGDRKAHPILFDIDNDGLTAFHYAALGGDFAINSVHIHLSDLDVQAVNRFGHTAKDLAIYAGHARFAESCNEFKAQIPAWVFNTHYNIQYYHNLDDTKREFYREQFAGSRKIGHSLLVNFRNRQDANNTFLHVACVHGMFDVAHQLLLGGANVNALNKQGDTPLHCAMKTKSAVIRYADQPQSHYRNYINTRGLAMVELLMRFGANPHYRNNDNKTPIECVTLDDQRVKFIGYKLERRRQKFDATYDYNKIGSNSKLDTKYWSKTLVGVSADNVCAEAAELQEVETVNLRLNYFRFAMQCALLELNAVYPDKLLNVWAVWKALRAEIVKTLNHFMQPESYDDTDAEHRQSNSKFKEDNPYQTFFDHCLHGDNGFIRQARVILLTGGLEHDRAMMQYLDHLKKMILACLAKDQELLATPGYTRK